MKFLTGSVVLMLVTLCLSEEEKETPELLTLLYTAETIHSSRGSSVTLSCEADYVFELCGLLNVVWVHHQKPCTNPNKYLTTVNEKLTGGGRRRRQVLTEILSITEKDNGTFQCTAECVDEGTGKTVEEAMGHFITVKVRG